jgi:hypothetical protein
VNEKTAIETPRARVFISCGQNKTTDEPRLASAIKDRLISMGFDPYVAVGEQSLRGLKENLFDQLQKAEYFLFVDFKRERLDGLDLHRGSLFSHQELAIASFLETDVLAFQEQGVKQHDGILGFIQGNAIPFNDREALPDLVSRTVKGYIDSSKWSPGWRSELVLKRDPSAFSDAVQTPNMQMSRFFHIGVENLHRRKVAMNCYAYLERATELNSRVETPLKTIELKWEGYVHPNAHILAGTTRQFDAFWLPHDDPRSVKFSAFCDASNMMPFLKESKYRMDYLVVSDNFPATRASFTLNLDELLDLVSLYRD